MYNKTNKGFTLIELLIVVAIIAILAAIAIPNYLAAQTRAKISRVKKEMQTLSTALEAYATDYNAYPIYDNTRWHIIGWAKLTTPIAYITKIPNDEFKWRGSWYSGMGGSEGWYWAYTNGVSTDPKKEPSAYTIWSIAPDLVHQIPAYRDRYQLENDLNNPNLVPLPAPTWWRYQGGSYNYDPTNGLMSFGDIWRASK